MIIKSEEKIIEKIRNKSVIVLDGPNGVGKSKFGTKISESLKIDLFRIDDYLKKIKSLI